MGGAGGGTSRATAEFGLSLQRCTLAGDDSHAHKHTSHTVSVLLTRRWCARACVCVCVMCPFVRKEWEVVGVNVFFSFFACYGNVHGVIVG